MYPDTDKPYGSLGSIFDIDITSYPEGWTLNPPYIESIINNLIEIIIKAENDTNGKLPIFMTLPYWDDLESVKKLMDSGFVRRRVIMEHNTYIYEDPVGNEIAASGLTTQYFIIGPEFSEEFYKELRSKWYGKSMKEVDESKVKVSQQLQAPITERTLTINKDSSSIMLFNDYANYLAVNVLLKELQLELEQTKYKKLLNIIEDYYIVRDNDFDNSLAFLETKLNENGLQNYVTKISEVLTREPVSTEDELKLSIKNMDTSFGDYKFHYTYQGRERINKLLSMGDELDYVKMLMKYGSIMGNNEQLSIPKEIYQVLVKYGFDKEGFASPLNSKMIDFPNGTYASLYPEVDSKFGSIGNFFSLAFAEQKLTQGGWVMKPPFINEVIDSLLTYVDNLLNFTEGNLKFFLVLPADRKYDSLDSNKYLFKRFQIKRGNYYFKNFDSNEKPSYDIVCYILGNNINQSIENEVITTWAPAPTSQTVVKTSVASVGGLQSKLLIRKKKE